MFCFHRNFSAFLPMILLVFFPKYSETTSWPGGNYGLLMPVSGCPRSNFTWKTGWRFQDTEDKNPRNSRSSVLHVEGAVRDSSVNRSFCMKTNAGDDFSIWPKGEFCIYKGSSTCPRGLQDGKVKWDDEDYQNGNKKSGFLPKGEYFDHSSTTIEFCCSNSGSKKNAITLPIDSPFYLLAYDSKECQQVQWAVATVEWIHYDTEDKNNADWKYGYYPYRARGGAYIGHTIYYCYYTSCKHVLNDTVGVLQSPFFPLNYPNGQWCSWTISVHPNQSIQLRFTQFSLVKTDQSDALEIYDGSDDSARMIGSYHGNGIPESVRSTSNHLFVIFRSDAEKSDKGFRAEYQAVNHQEPSTTTVMSSVHTTNETSNTTASFPIPWNSKACAQNQVTEVPAASIVVPVIMCLAAVLVVTAALFWRWREVRRGKENTHSIRYQASAVENPVYNGTVSRSAENYDTDKSPIVLEFEVKEDLYQEVNDQQMNNPLYESTDSQPTVSGNILYDSTSTKSHAKGFGELP